MKIAINFWLNCFLKMQTGSVRPECRVSGVSRDLFLTIWLDTIFRNILLKITRCERFVSHFFIIFFCPAFADSALTYELNGGRFGDSIQTYCKAQYLKYVHAFDHFFYVPFEYSNCLALDLLDEKYSNADQFSKKIKVNKESDINLSSAATIHICHFYTQIPNLFEFSTKNPEFKKLLQERISPIIPISYIDLPTDKTSIAVHVRKGGGFDKPLATQQLYSGHESLVSYHFQSSDEMKAYAEKVSPYADLQWPSKFPPDQYYIDQIKKISALLEHQPLYVFLFTDDPEPEKLLKKYKQIVNLKNVKFDCYKKKKYYKAHVLDDFFNMARFDCLIRGSSLFAQAAQLIGNHKIIIFPKHTTIIDNKIVVDKVGVVIHHSKILDNDQAHTHIFANTSLLLQEHA